MLGNGKCEGECDREECGFDGGDCITEANPVKLYVSVTPRPVETGSFTAPFSSLSTAFLSIWSDFTSIYLLSGTHSLKLNEFDPVLDPLSESSPAFLWIQTLLCANSSSDHPECASAPAQLLAPQSQITLKVAHKLTISDLIIRGNYDMVPGCFSQLCTYCPYTIFNASAGVWISDKGKVVDLRLVADQSVCAQYENFDFIEVAQGGVLHIERVAFRWHRQQVRSMIFSDCAGVRLVDVEFEDIQPARNSAVSAVIRQQTSADGYCGWLEYIGGRVSLLNNGYEVQRDSLSSGFLRGVSYESVVLDSVLFEYNNVRVGDKTGADSFLMYFGNPRQVVVRNCVFRFNMAVTGGAFFISSNQGLPGTVGADGSLIEQNMVHFLIENSQFVNNTAESGAAFAVSFAGDHQNIIVRNCSFVHNFATTDGIVEFINAILTDEFTVGVVSPQLVGEAVLMVFYPPRYVVLEELNFTENFGRVIVAMDNVGQLRMKNVRFFGCGQPSSSLTFFDYVIQGFLSNPLVYFSGVNIPKEAPKCSNLLSLLNVYNVSTFTIRFSSSYCEDGSSGLFLQGNTSILSIERLRMDGNSGKGAVCSMSLITSLKLTGVLCEGNSGDHRSIGVCLSLTFLTPASLSITNSTFRNNIGSDAVSMYIANAQSVVMRNVTIGNNTGTNGCAGMMISSLAVLPSTVILTEIFVRNNSNFDMATVAVVDTGGKMGSHKGVFLHFQLTNSDFSGNTGSRAGTGFAIYDYLLLSNASGIHNTSFTRNTNNEQGAAVSLSFFTGNFSIDHCVFLNNSSPRGSAIFSTHRMSVLRDSVVALASSEFRENGGGSVVHVIGTGDRPWITTKELRFVDNRSPSFWLASGELTDEGSAYVGNQAASGPVVYSVSGSIVAIEDCIAGNNTASSYGGVVYVTSGSSTALIHCTVSNNTSGKVGGVAYIDKSSTLSITDTVMQGNTAMEKGAVIYGLYSGFTVVRSVLVGNHAGTFGSIYASDSNLSFTTVSLFANTANGMTAGIVCILSQIQVTNSSFTGQIGDSGAVFAIDQSRLMVNYSRFSDCVALSFGGAISSSASEIEIADSEVRNCSAKSGSFLSLAHNSGLTMTGVKIEDVLSIDGLGSVNQIGGRATISSSVFLKNSGGTLYITNTQLSISNCDFIQCSGKQGGSIYLVNSPIVIVGSRFRGNSGVQGGAIYLAALVKVSIVIFDSRFEENVAPFGAAIYTESADGFYSRNVFYRNSAIQIPGILGSGSGGAFYFGCYLYVTCNITLTGNTFEQNSAQVRGGAVLWQMFPPTFSNNTFENNTAVYGPKIASNAVRLMLINRDLTPVPYLNDTQTPPLAVEIDNLGSGFIYDGQLRVGLFDHQGQLVTMDSSSAAEMVIPTHSNLTIFGDIKSIASAGGFKFTQFTIAGTPGSMQEIHIKTPSIRQQTLSAYDLSLVSDSILVRVTFRLCLIGEVLENNKCIECPKGTYSFSPTQACSSCPDGAVCFGNYTMVPMPGYWRADPLSAVFFECDNFEACIGSPPYPHISPYGVCAKGYTGNLCSACQPSHSKTGKNVCAECPSFVINMILTGSIVVGMMIFLAVVIFIAIRSANRPNSEIAVYVKILMNYVQMVVVSASLNMKWPSYATSFLNAQVMIGNAAEQIFSVDCILQQIYSERLFYSKIIITTMLPLILISLSIAAWMVIRVFKEVPLLKEKLMSSFVMILFLLHTTITKTEFSMFSCKELKQGELWLLHDLDQRCWSRSHLQYILIVGLPSVTVWVVGLPLLCLANLYRKRIGLHSPKFQMQFSFLYKGYTRNRFYWEFVILYRKILLVVSLVFLAPVSAAVTAQTVLAVLLVSVIFQIHIEPFNIQIMNTLEVKSILVSLVTIYCGLYYESDAMSKG